MGSDIVPVHPFARSLTTAEGTVGQLFPAILIGALVAMAMESVANPESFSDTATSPGKNNLPRAVCILQTRSPSRAFANAYMMNIYLDRQPWTGLP